MSKRSRRSKNANAPADEKQVEQKAVELNSTENQRDNHNEIECGQDEPQLIVAGDAFQKFDAWIDDQLETMVSRWIHTAAPAASAVRRVIPQESRRKSGQA
jgi:hypothetical protein